MIEQIAHNIATKIKNANPEQTASIEVMKFSIIGIINNSITFLFIFIIAILNGYYLETTMALIGFVTLRLFGGGFHFNSPLSCIIVSTVAITSVPYISIVFDTRLTIICTSISLLLNLIFAPSNIKRTRITSKLALIYKFVTLFIVSSNFLLLSPIFAIAFLLQSVSIIERKEA